MLSEKSSRKELWVEVVRLGEELGELEEKYESMANKRAKQEEKISNICDRNKELDDLRRRCTRDLDALYAKLSDLEIDNSRLIATVKTQAKYL